MENLYHYLPPLYGAGVIVFYAYGRFNEASFDTRMGIQRLNSLLRVSQMRTGSVVRLSLLYYIAGLLAIYLLVSAYVLLFSVNIDLKPATIGGLAPEPIRDGMGSNGAIFLSVALAVVGLGPNIPYIRNIEGWLRRSAHGIAGIPTRVLAHTRELVDKDFVEGEAQIQSVVELLSTRDRELIKILKKRRDPALLRDIMLIAAVDAWILNSSSIVGESQLHNAFARLEEDLRRRKRDLFTLLWSEVRSIDEGLPTFGRWLNQKITDEISNLDDARPPSASNAAPDPGSIPAQSQADQLGDDMCVLLALYREHGLLKRSDARAEEDNTVDSLGTSPHEIQNAKSEWQYSRDRRRRNILNDFVDRGTPETQFDQVVAQKAMCALSWTFGLVAMLSLSWSIWPGIWEQQIKFPDMPEAADLPWGERLAGHVAGNLLNFFLPIAFSVGIWQGATASRSWGMGLNDHWTRAMPKALLILLGSWIVGTFFAIGVSLWIGAIATGWQQTGQAWLSSLVSIFTSQSPLVARGALLAVFVVGCLDRWQLGSTPSWKSEWIHGLLAGLLVGLTGGIAQLFLNFLNPASSESWPAAYRAGSALYGGLFSALFAFCIILTLSSALRARQLGASNIRLSQAKPAPTNQVLTMSTYGAFLLVITSCLVPSNLFAESIIIGVRDNARPYIWVEKDADGGMIYPPKGYLWEVCVLLAANANLTYEVEIVGAARRDSILSGNNDLTEGQKEIDLLCDPTTITLTRIHRLSNAGWHVSPIFHLANRGYLDRSPQEVDSAFSLWKNCINAYRSANSEPRGLGCIRLTLLEKIDVSPENIAVQGTTAADSLDCEAPNTCFFAASHEAAAERFCTSTEAVRYHGDAELILAAAHHWERLNSGVNRKAICIGDRKPTVQEPISPQDDSDLGETPDVRNYEPYALIISNKRVVDLNQRLTLELYRLASERRLRSMLESHFSELRMSRDLESLFRILSIPAGPIGLPKRQDDIASTPHTYTTPVEISAQ